MAQAPPNDNFADAIVWTTNSGTFIATNTLATEEPDEPGWWLAGASGSLWWRWIAPSNGDFSFNTAGSSNLNTLTTVFTGDGAYSNLTQVVGFQAASASSQDVTFFAREGRMYHFRFSGFDDQPYGVIAGSYSFTPFVIPTNGPINDYFERRIPLTGLTNIVVDDNSTATFEPGEPMAPRCAPAAGSMWWSYTTPTNGILRIQAGGYSNSVVCAVYRGDVVDQLDLVASACEQPINFGVAAGETYHISVSSLYGKAGGFALNLFLFPPPPHDNFADSDRFEGTNLVHTGRFVGATHEPGEPEADGTNTVWASWAAPFNGRVRYWLGGSVNLFTGPTLDHLTAVPLIVVNSEYNFIASEGTVYHFQFSGVGEDYALNLDATPFPMADNDRFADARVAGATDVIRFSPASVYGATMETGEPHHSESIPQKSLWWRWQAPRHGVLKLSATSLFIPRVMLAVYQGSSVDALGLVTKGTNQVVFRGTAGETYHIAAAVPDDAVGDVTLFAQQTGLSATQVMLPGNILKEPSFENAAEGFQYWHAVGDLGGYVNERRGGADGQTWPALGTGAMLWQDVPTIPGHEYALQLAFLFGRDLSGCCGIAGYRVYWDANIARTSGMPEEEMGFWRWDVVTFQATNTTTRITFENLHRILEVDAFSFVDLSAPPAITTQPSTVSTIAGGAAAFVVAATGSTPLAYQWFRNGAPLDGQNSGTLVIEPVTASDAGHYHVVVSNSLGVATSATASLLVDNPTNVTILLQPYGAVIAAGSYFSLSVVAAGTPPLSYQWYRDGAPLAEGTNRYLTFAEVDLTNAGTYEMRVQNYGGSAFSLPATLVVTNAIDGGGTLDFNSFTLKLFGGTNDAPVFDVDALTRLNGSDYVAQLYAGVSLETMRPASAPTPFLTAFQAGYYRSKVATLPHIPPSATILAQVRVWEMSHGNSYEEARALGGKFGRSPIVQVTLNSALAPPQRLFGLSSFNLEAGLPEFTTGQIEFLQRNSDDSLLWQLRGEAGFRYVVEKTSVATSLDWHPFVVLTNAAGTVTFSDQTGSGDGTALYRARILD